MTPESERRPPAKETASDDAPSEIDDNTPGFWGLASMGKVRPICREPERTWYR